MRVPAYVTGLMLAGSLGAGCATHAETLTPVPATALNAPEPPGRYVLPPTDQPTLPPAIEEPQPSSAAPVTPRTPARNPNPRPTAPPSATEPPPPAPTPAPAILLTSANNAEFEKRVRAQLDVAKGNLEKVSRPALGTEAQAHFDAASGFVRQAEEALKVKNLIYAGQLADKAATMAALLRK